MVIEDDLSLALARYYERSCTRIHPFEAAAIFHHWFESNHPFAGGHGREGRKIFNQLQKIDRVPALPFSGTGREHFLDALALGDD